MNDPLLVRGGQAVRNLDSVIHGFTQRQRTVLQPVAQCFTFQQFCHEVRAALVSSKLIDGYDIGVIERCRGLSFLFETRQAVRIGKYEIGQDLDGDLAVQQCVVGAIHFAHRTRPKWGADFILPKDRSGSEGHGASAGLYPQSPYFHAQKGCNG